MLFEVTGFILFKVAVKVVCRDRVIVWLIHVLFRESTKQLFTDQFVVPLFNREFLDMARNWGEMLGSPTHLCFLKLLDLCYLKLQ